MKTAGRNLTNLTNLGNRYRWLVAATRWLAVAAVVLALGLAGTAFTEYRLLEAATRLPVEGYERVLSFDCPVSAGTIGSGPAIGIPAEPPDSPFKPDLRGFSCTVLFTPD